MPPGENGTGAPPPAAEGSGIDALPDGVLAHILGFLPAEEAVRTCVLAPRWRDLWKSATGLRIVAADGKFLGTVEKLQEFVDHLLRAREDSGLDTCEFSFGDFSSDMWPTTGGEFPEDVQRRVSLWFRHAVTCRARVLRLRVQFEGVCMGDPWLEVDGQPLISQHLTRLELGGVEVHCGFLDISTCPAMEHIVLESCDLMAVNKEISFGSLKHLSITDTFFCPDSHIRIYAPNLVSLHLDELLGRTPVLESMPLLVEAFVGITSSEDYCEQRAANIWDCDCESCDSFTKCGGNNNCVLLKGLSEAKSLALISESDQFIFKRDLRFCPTFTKVKTLLLNDYWCVPDDFRALACILEHSPVLEKLTFQLRSKGPNNPQVEMKGCVTPMEGSADILEHLKIVEVKCQVIDERIKKLALFLCAFNIRFSFEQSGEETLAVDGSTTSHS